MSSRQLCSKGASDGQSLPDRTRKGKKSSDQQTMDQQSSPQPEQHTRPGSVQQQTGDSATPATSLAPRAESTPLQTTGLTQTPAVQVGLLSRIGSPQVQLPNTQTGSSHISPMPCPLFTEDRLSSNKQEMCDQEVTTLIQDKHQQDHQLLFHQELDLSQQWTTPPKEIQTNQHLCPPQD